MPPIHLTDFGLSWPKGMVIKKAALTGLTTDSRTAGDFITNDNTLVFNGTDTRAGVLGIWIINRTYTSRTLIGTVNLALEQESWTFDCSGPALAGIVFSSLFVFALSAAGAIYLVLELGQPFSGLMQISSAPLRNALMPL